MKRKQRPIDDFSTVEAEDASPPVKKRKNDEEQIESESQTQNIFLPQKAAIIHKNTACAADFYQLLLKNKLTQQKDNNKNSASEVQKIEIPITKETLLENSNNKSVKTPLKKYPLDRTIKSEMKIVSKDPFNWFDSNFKYEEVKVSALNREWRHIASQFTFPQELPHDFYQLLTKHKDGNTQHSQSFVVNFFDNLKLQWKEALSSAFIELQNIRCENEEIHESCFYVIFEKYYIVFGKSVMNSENGVTFWVMISPSTKSLRMQLTENNIEFTMPFDPSNKIKYYDKLDPDQLCNSDRSKYDQSILSQLLIIGLDDVIQFIRFLHCKIETDYYSNSMHLPKILARFQYHHSINEYVNIKQTGQFTRNNELDVEILYRIELNGLLLPNTVKNIYKYLRCNHSAFHINFTTIPCTTSFNLPVPISTSFLEEITSLHAIIFSEDKSPEFVSSSPQETASFQ